LIASPDIKPVRKNTKKIIDRGRVISHRKNATATLSEFCKVKIINRHNRSSMIAGFIFLERFDFSSISYPHRYKKIIMPGHKNRRPNGIDFFQPPFI